MFLNHHNQTFKVTVTISTQGCIIVNSKTMLRAVLAYAVVAPHTRKDVSSKTVSNNHSYCYNVTHNLPLNDRHDQCLAGVKST